MRRGHVSGWVERAATTVDVGARWLARHWLAVVNLTLLVYVVLPLLAPVFMALGWKGVGEAIYIAYRPFCHQLPERSFFLFGPRATYTLQELAAVGLPVDFDLGSLWARRVFLGSAALGYKMAFCQRDLALYGALALGGLGYGLLRTRVRPLSWRVFVLLWVPLAVDGSTQLVGLRESTWLLRVITGGIAGVATVWALYPRLDRAMRST